MHLYILLMKEIWKSDLELEIWFSHFILQLTQYMEKSARIVMWNTVC